MWRGSSHAGQLKELCHSESRHVCLRLTKQNKHDLFKSSCASSGKARRRSGWCALVRAKSSKPATKRSSRRNLRVLTDSLEQKIALERRDRSMFLPSSCCWRSSFPPEKKKMLDVLVYCRQDVAVWAVSEEDTGPRGPLRFFQLGLGFMTKDTSE